MRAGVGGDQRNLVSFAEEDGGDDGVAGGGDGGTEGGGGEGGEGEGEEGGEGAANRPGHQEMDVEQVEKGTGHASEAGRHAQAAANELVLGRAKAQVGIIKNKI